MRWKTWLFLLFFLGLPVWIQEAHLACVLGSSQWWAFLPNTKSMVTDRSGREADGVSWKVNFSSGSGGYNSDIAATDRNGHKLYWRTNLDGDYPEILVAKGGTETRFLSYQFYWLGSNHVIQENPSLIHTGIWLIEHDKTGFKATPIVTNPVSILLRDPLFVVYVVFNRLGW